ncbi:unnamed protein product [Phytophthora fragariaefolia]|uniref:Unnamed protein product n=1 Tax=Phytophthora fragariaefolia TaxID=1490495 RepID=A0A9W6U5T9_9STRA|nr:unnamed protein product [Phytophthora fragariaefolia]
MSDIRQEAGKRHLNAGEILPAGVTALIDTVGDIDNRDLFLDVGCGLGNVVAQVAVQTSASKCYGIEVRGDVLCRGIQLMKNDSLIRKYIAKINLLHGDASTILLQFDRPFSNAIIILAHHRLFEGHI